MRFFDELGGFLPAGTFESFRADLGLDYAHATMILIAAAPGAIAGNAFAIAADHRSRRAITATGAFGFALALTGYALGHSFVVLLASSFALGMFATALVDAAELALIDISGDRADDNIARSMMVSSIGDLAGPALLIVVTAAGLGWRAAFAIAAVIMAVYGVWVCTLPLPRPTKHEHLGGWRDGIREVWRMPAVWYVGIAAMLVAPLDESFLAFLIAKLQRSDGLSVGTATAIATATIAGELTAFAIGTRAGRPSLVRNAAVLALSAAACGLVPAALAAIPAVIFGLAMGRAWLAVKFRAISIWPERRGTVSAVVSTIEFTGFVLPLAAGALADAYGLRAGLLCYVAIATALCALAIQANRARAI